MTDVDRELGAIIRHEADAVIPPDGARDRGWARLNETLARGGADAEPAVPAPPARTPWLRIVPFTALIVGSLALLGAWIHRSEPVDAATIVAAAEPEPKIAPIPISIPLAAQRPSAAPPAEPTPPSTTATTRRTSSPRPAVKSDEDAFAAELRLLAAAQAAIQRGELSDGLSTLREHARRYPTGHFAQDRDALLAIARCQAEQSAAKAAARKFLAAHPTSIHAERVRDACEL